MDTPNGRDNEEWGDEPMTELRLPEQDGEWLATLMRDDEDPGLARATAMTRGAIAAVHFDPQRTGSGTIVALVHYDDLTAIERGRYVTVSCKGDGRRYIGRIAEGPFFEPDVLRAESTPVKFLIINQDKAAGKVLSLPEYHGVIVVELLGEDRGGQVVGARRRPHPGSPIFAQDQATMATMFNIAGDLVLGQLDGYPDVPLLLDSRVKNVVARHWLTSGGSGGGKSNTNQVLMEELLAASFAQVIVDAEGENIFMDQPVDDPDVAEQLAPYGRVPAGVCDLRVYRPPKATSKRADAIAFSVPFESLAPEVIVELTEMNNAQEIRFMALYEQAIALGRKLGRTDGDLGDRDDADVSRGFPGTTLAMLTGMLDDELAYYDWKKNYEAAFERAEKQVKDREKAARKAASSKRPPLDMAEDDDDDEDPFAGIPPKPGAYFRTHPMPPLVRDYQDVTSFGALRKHLRNLARLGVFDQPDAPPLSMAELTTPGRLSVIDMSDTQDNRLMNIILADILARMFAYKMKMTEEENAARKVMITIEEAHNFVPRARLDRVAQTFHQLLRIMRRGRKRWLVMHFVTQSPQHLPDELFELASNKIIHQTTGAENIRVLRQAVGDVHEAIWTELPTLGRGRAIVASSQFPHPLLVQIRPAASRRNYSQ